MKTNFTLFISFFFFFSDLHAQIADFDLTQYARPTIIRRSLDMNLELSGSNYLRLPANQGPNSNVAQYYGEVFLDYSLLKNLPQYQESTNIVLRLNPFTRSSTTEGQSINRRRSLDSYLSAFSRRYKFLNDQNWFIGIEASLSFTGKILRDLSRNLDNSDPEMLQAHNAQNGIFFSSPLVVGKGRIELVQDARMALFILKELERRNYLVREITETDILSFSQKISAWKNKRYFDFRIQKIWELEQLHAFLMENEMVERTDPTYYAVVQDIWNFGNDPVRRTGDRLSVGFNPHLRTEWSNRTRELLRTNLDSSFVENIDRNFNFEPSLHVSYIRERPFKEAWQSSFQVRGEFGLSYYAINRLSDSNGQLFTFEDKQWRNMPTFESSISYAVGFYPNTRTFITGFLSTELTHFFNNPSQSNPTVPLQDLTYGVCRIDISGYYYLSPETRLNLSFRPVFASTVSGNLLDRPGEVFPRLVNNGRLSQGIFLGLSHAWF